MGDYKDKHGRTRVGVFLQEVAPELLNVAGSLTGIKALSKISETIQGTIKLNPAQKANALELLNLDIQDEQERTKRHAADMASDSWLSKNIRPMTLIFLLVVVTVICVLDSASTSFEVAQGYISLFTTLLLTIFGFYFVGREINKVILNRKNNNSKNSHHE